ncbi:monovalent cation/H+ antiporter subunit D family protein [Pseudomarimonas arenosa]|uniref:Monovalent cation/H+ antiporter subunit D family protein n=1 Tax=Pseudomarimonas arenosa TaxID=2774145 RepID=A0AAW3ZG93_9GAMM|nr:monovalent cation/H+ antiporter subunit D family protein [Pseudomarimonas arenosa]MBD8525150.1 monovalent cation/H+ antiporter subunit D family protein [Pseudomarimonas arenosa]
MSLLDKVAEHLPILPVVLPLLAAPLTVLLRQRTLAFLLTMLVVLVSLICSVWLLVRVGELGVISYAIGGWPPPIGIEYRADALNALVMVLVNLIASLVLPYSQSSIREEISYGQHYLYYTMLLLCIAGLNGICMTGDAFNLFVFLEISSLSTYVLIALGRDRRALVAAYQYLIMGTIGATFIVIGVGFLYLMTGTLNLADMAGRLGEAADLRPVLAALAFLTVGVSLKLALFPLHQWLPNAYAFAPSPVSAFLAATATKVAVYVLLRIYFSVFGDARVFEQLPMRELMLLLALAGMFVASAVAIYQADLKRLFAYSSVAQIGYIVLGIAFATVNGLTASIVHLINHGVTKGAIFMLLGGVALRAGGVQMSDLRGLASRMPITSFAMVLAGLSLIGVPGTAGFISKWYLVLAAIETGQWWLVFAILLSSLLAVIYVWRFVEVAYLSGPRRNEQIRGEAPLGYLLPSLAMLSLALWFGWQTEWTVVPAKAAAEWLLSAGP